MTELMSLLYEYAQSHRVEGFLDQTACREAERLEERNLAALERYQDVCLERQAMEERAAFQAGFSIARELF